MIPTPRRVRSVLGPVALSLAAGIAVLAVGMLVNSCRVNKLLTGGGSAPNTIANGPIQVNPSQVRDSALAGTFEARRTSLEITNGGRWAASIDSPWIGLSPIGGVGRNTVTLALDPQGLRPGTHEGSVTVRAPESETDPVTVPVTFFIQQPFLSVDPKEFSRTSRSSGDRFTDTLRIKNTGTGPLVWTASNKSTWLTLEVVAGVGDGKIPVRMSSAGLGIATFKDTIVVVAVGAYGSPAKIPVTFKRQRDH